MRSLFRCWLPQLDTGLKETYLMTYRLGSILKIDGDFKRHKCHRTSRILCRHNEIGEKHSENNHPITAEIRSCSHYYGLVPHVLRKQDQQSSEERLIKMVEQEMKAKFESYLETNLSKLISSNIDYLLHEDENRNDYLERKTTKKVCELYMNKIADACAAIQVVPSDDKELIIASRFAVGYLPLRKYKDFIEFDKKLQTDPGFRYSFIRLLRNLQMPTAKETIYRMIGFSIADSVRCMYNGYGQGNTGKLSFINTELCQIILHEVSLMFPSVDSWVMKSLVSKKMYQVSLNMKYRKQGVYKDAMEELQEIREKPMDKEKENVEVNNPQYQSNNNC